MKPGKPVAFAILEGKPVFALPGNPAAAMISFEVFVRPALLKMTGQPRTSSARPCGRPDRADGERGDRPHLIRVRVRHEQDGYAHPPPATRVPRDFPPLTAADGLSDDQCLVAALLASGESVSFPAGPTRGPACALPFCSFFGMHPPDGDPLLQRRPRRRHLRVYRHPGPVQSGSRRLKPTALVLNTGFGDRHHLFLARRAFLATVFLAVRGNLHPLQLSGRLPPPAESTTMLIVVESLSLLYLC